MGTGQAMARAASDQSFATRLRWQGGGRHLEGELVRFHHGDVVNYLVTLGRIPRPAAPTDISGNFPTLEELELGGQRVRPQMRRSGKRLAIFAAATCGACRKISPLRSCAR